MKRPRAACSVCPWGRLLGPTVLESYAARESARKHCASSGHVVEVFDEHGVSTYRVVHGRVIYDRLRVQGAVETRG